MAQTPNPTDAEFLETLTLVDGGTFPAVQELVRRLEENVPAKTALLNTKLGLTGARKITAPKAGQYGVAPGILTDAFIDSILVDVATTTGEKGYDAFENQNQVVVYSVGKRIKSVTQVEDAHYRAAIIRGALYAFRDTTIDENDRTCWRRLAPTGYSLLPDQYNEFSGVACYYTMTQPPVDNFWGNIGD